MENYLPCYEKNFGERCEKSINCEINLAEYLPNVSKIIKVSAVALCDECDALKDAVNVQGRIKFRVVYLSDFKDRLKCASVECEFSHTFPAKGIEAAVGDTGYIDCDVSLSDEKGQVISQRKLTVSCKAFISVQVHTLKKTEIYDTGENDSVHKLCKAVEYMERRRLEDFEISVEDNISPDEGMPEIKEIVFSECSIASFGAAAEGGKVTYSGTLRFGCMYLAENDEGEQYISFSKDLPFTEIVDMQDIPDGCFIVCKAHCVDASAEGMQNNYGEMSICSLHSQILVSPTAFCTCEAEVLCDAFCTGHDCSCESKIIPYDTLVCGTTEIVQTTESVRANLGSITEIVSKNITASVISTELSGKVPIYNMRAQLGLMGTNEQGGLECVNISFSFKVVSGHELEAVPERYRFDSRAYVNKCDCRIENGEIKCELTLEICSCISARAGTQAVTAMIIDTDTEICRDKSEYILYYPDDSDTVWSCAKKYRVSPKALLSVNGMGLFDTDFGDMRVVVIPSSEG